MGRDVLREVDVHANATGAALLGERPRVVGAHAHGVWLEGAVGVAAVRAVGRSAGLRASSSVTDQHPKALQHCVRPHSMLKM